MTESDDERADPTRKPRADAESAGSSDDDSRYTNAARALALGAQLSGRRVAIEGIESDIVALGAPIEVRAPSSDARAEAVAEADDVLRELDASAVLEIEAANSSRLGRRSTEPAFADQRVEAWQVVQQNPQELAYLYAWLRLLMAEEDPLLHASASSALSHWRRPAKASDSETPFPLRSARTNIERLVNDSDPEVSEIAQATVGRPSPNATVRESRSRRPPIRQDLDSVSLLVHGTFAFPEKWWFPGGDFHDYVKQEIRSNVYDAKDTFWWSGRYKSRDRASGAERLAGWAEAKGAGRLDAVFAHSYGGAVALQATTWGLEMDTAVLLSTPVDNYEVEWRNIGRAVSLRIHCDLVLLAARTKQKFTANVEEHWIDSWFVRHAASHECGVWVSGGWASELGL